MWVCLHWFKINHLFCGAGSIFVCANISPSNSLTENDRTVWNFILYYEATIGICWVLTLLSLRNIDSGRACDQLESTQCIWSEATPCLLLEKKCIRFLSMCIGCNVRGALLSSAWEPYSLLGHNNDQTQCFPYCKTSLVTIEAQAGYLCHTCKR